MSCASGLYALTRYNWTEPVAAIVVAAFKRYMREMPIIFIKS